VLNLSVDQAPAGYRLTRDAASGHRYLYTVVDKPKDTVNLATSFTIHRNPVSLPLDAKKAGQLTDSQRTLFAEYLRRDVPNMEVDDAMIKLADKICGDETNLVVQARKLFDYVVENTAHYSKEGAPKNSGLGCATYCLEHKGGGCTDQHALFSALARARGIPTRLHFGSRLVTANAGKDFDPGYRCWVTFFVPNYGWVPLDISAANTNPDKRDFYFGGLDDRRIRFSEGRDLELSPKQAGPRLNLWIVAYVEVDDKPHMTLSAPFDLKRSRSGVKSHKVPPVLSWMRNQLRSLVDAERNLGDIEEEFLLLRRGAAGHEGQLQGFAGRRDLEEVARIG